MGSPTGPHLARPKLSAWVNKLQESLQKCLGVVSSSFFTQAPIFERARALTGGPLHWARSGGRVDFPENGDFIQISEMNMFGQPHGTPPSSPKIDRLAEQTSGITLEVCRRCCQQFFPPKRPFLGEPERLPVVRSIGPAQGEGWISGKWGFFSDF